MHACPILFSLAILAFLPLEARTETPLFSTMHGMPAAHHGVASQVVSDRGSSALRAADDFVVPPTEAGWTVTAVEVNGMYLNRPDSPAPPRAVQVYVYDDNAGTPRGLAADEARFAAAAPAFVDVDAGDFHITLPGEGVFLPPGRYWLSVVVAMPVASGGQWVWTESASAVDSGRPNGHESVWTQTPRLTPYGCVDGWEARCGVCGVFGDPMDDIPDPDLAFTLYGVAGAHPQNPRRNEPRKPAGETPPAATGASMANLGGVGRGAMGPRQEGASPEVAQADDAVDVAGGVLPVSLSDLVQIIALYNAGGYACILDPEGACGASPFDGAPRDWRISLSELLRVVQFYRAGGYRACPGSEDGYCPAFD